MEIETHRRERFVQATGVIVALLLFSSFFLPRGFSSSWQFGWDAAKNYDIILGILQVFSGLALAAMVLLPLPRLLKGLVLCAVGFLLTLLYTFQSVDSLSAFFSRPSWLSPLMLVLFSAVAASLAFNADSDRDGSGRQAFGLVAGAGMLLIGTFPMDLVVLQSPMANTAFLEIWQAFRGSIGLLDFFFLLALLVVISAGPIAGALLMGHSAIAIVAPQKRLLAAGPIAGMAFLFWPAAALFLSWLAMWASAKVVFTTYFAFLAPSLGCAVLLSVGIFYLCEAFARDPERAASLHPGLGMMVLAALPSETDTVDGEMGWPPRSVDTAAVEPVAGAWNAQAEPSTDSAEPAWAQMQSDSQPRADLAAPSPDALVQEILLPLVAAQPSLAQRLDEHWVAGNQAWAEQNWEQALHHFGQVFSLEPSKIEAAKAIADIYYGLGDVDRAEQYYSIVLRAWPDNDYSRGALAQIAAYRQQK